MRMCNILHITTFTPKQSIKKAIKQKQAGKGKETVQLQPWIISQFGRSTALDTRWYHRVLQKLLQRGSKD